MVRNIFITNDNQDNISIFEKEPVYLVNFPRDDFSKLGNLEEAKKPGIYILIGENKRYVGQASSSILSRLNSHEKSKDFWTSCIFFGRNDGLIDKSQLDYLEKYYIQQFQEAGFDMDNDTVGNNSKIQKLNRIKADEMRDIFEEILGNVANIDLFTSHIPLSDDVVDVGMDVPKVLSVTFDGQVITGKTARGLEVKFVQFLLNHDKYGKNLADFIIDDRPGNKNILGRKPHSFINGLKATYEVQEGIFLWVHQTKPQTKSAIKKIAEWLGLPVEINF